jgi:phage-related holin
VDAINNLIEATREAPLIVAAFLLTVLDLAYAVLRHATGRNTYDPPILQYAEGKVTIIFILLVAAVIDPLIPSVPILDGTALFYIAASLANILDAAERDGAPLPPQLIAVVRSLKESAGVVPGVPNPPLTPAPTPTPEGSPHERH